MVRERLYTRRKGKRIKRWMRGNNLIKNSNPKKWLGQQLNKPIELRELEEKVNIRIDILTEKRDELNERKRRIRDKLEAMTKIKEGERVTPSFYRRMQTSFKKEEIFKLEENGIETTSEKGINNIATKFYTELWKNRRGTREFSERRRSQMIAKIKHKISDETREKTNKKLTVNEVKEATKALLKDKSPGIDGIPAEFYQEFEYITEWLYDILIETEKNKLLTKTMRTSVVKLLFKKGDRTQIGNYRPLSLANTDYKIFAKVITERMKVTLNEIIGTEQQGFIKGGDITGNLILVKEIIEYCNEENIEAYIIMMDFKKAYDRIDRETVEITLRAMNFGENIINMIKLLYAGSEAVIVTNDIKGEQFSTKGGVKQGCPLSPYLFIIVLELMAIEMRDDRHIKGVTL